LERDLLADVGAHDVRAVRGRSEFHGGRRRVLHQNRNMRTNDEAAFIKEAHLYVGQRRDATQSDQQTEKQCSLTHL
jgi:hypothetical protein